MMLARGLDGRLVEPMPGARARCPACDGEVLARCGELVTAHWAHVARDCDPWSEPESPWHRGWKLHAPAHRREVVIGSHRADLVTAEGIVVEVQHSSIRAAEVRERERHYGRMLWIFDARSAFASGRLRPWIGAAYDVAGVALHDSETLYAWEQPRRDWTAATMPVLLDTGKLRDSKGGDWSEWPADLRVRDFPEVRRAA